MLMGSYGYEDLSSASPIHTALYNVMLQEPGISPASLGPNSLALNFTSINSGYKVGRQLTQAAACRAHLPRTHAAGSTWQRPPMTCYGADISAGARGSGGQQHVVGQTYLWDCVEAATIDVLWG